MHHVLCPEKKRGGGEEGDVLNILIVTQCRWHIYDFSAKRQVLQNKYFLLLCVRTREKWIRKGRKKKENCEKEHKLYGRWWRRRMFDINKASCIKGKSQVCVCCVYVKVEDEIRTWERAKNRQFIFPTPPSSIWHLEMKRKAETRNC